MPLPRSHSVRAPLSLAVGLVGAVTSTGCYTVQQGYHQARLFLRREPIDEVLARGKETPERLRKLSLVPGVLGFARDRVGLETGASYTHYIALDGPSVTYVVQAAEKRALRFRSWWFPVVGSQPYLGYFVRESAVAKRDELVKEGYDTTLGGVQAFSLLGYFPDPLYSSMLDGNETPDLVEVLLHECLHRTVYVADFSAFNENLADFVAKRATSLWLSEHPDQGDVKAYEERYRRTLAAQGRFKGFLVDAKERLEDFYARAKDDAALRDDTAFAAAREKEFDAIAAAYLAHMGGTEEGTGYEWAFRKGRINNAVILGYSLYEAKQAPFERAFEAAGGDVRRFVANMKRCLGDGRAPSGEDELWRRVEECGR